MQKSIALSTKNVLHYRRFLQVLYLATQLPKITKGSLWEAEGLEEEAKVCFISLIPRFPLQLFPLQLFQDHRDRNVEASGIAVTCSFHQAVPGSLQVVIPVRNI
jgi:hypothetical protein